MPGHVLLQGLVMPGHVLVQGFVAAPCPQGFAPAAAHSVFGDDNCQESGGLTEKGREKHT
jgi:hypothetical protein